VARKKTKDDNKVSGVEEEGSGEKAGEARLLETTGIGCGVGPDRQPSENRGWTITSNTHPAKV
jgi:hypothetical protein